MGSHCYCLSLYILFVIRFSICIHFTLSRCGLSTWISLDWLHSNSSQLNGLREVHMGRGLLYHAYGNRWRHRARRLHKRSTALQMELGWTVAFTPVHCAMRFGINESIGIVHSYQLSMWKTGFIRFIFTKSFGLLFLCLRPYNRRDRKHCFGVVRPSLRTYARARVSMTAHDVIIKPCLVYVMLNRC